MKIQSECPECLEKLVRRTADMATNDERLKNEALEKSLALLRDSLKHEKITIRIAANTQRLIRHITGNRDPFRAMKDTEIEIGRNIFHRVNGHYNSDLRSLITLSVLGNRVDFFRDIEAVKKETGEPIEFAIDDIARLGEELPGIKKILFLADNAGECYFDLPLIDKLKQKAEVVYVVKEEAVQNDSLVEDLRLAGMYGRFPRVITTGTDSPGVDMDFVSGEFKEEFANADLLLAKGMGCWETLTEYPLKVKIFYLLMAKCPPVARSLGVPLNHYIAKLVP